MSIFETIKQFLPVSSRSAHAMHRELGAVHSELAHLQGCMDELRRDMEAFDIRSAHMMWDSLRKEGEDLADTKKRFFREMAPATGIVRLRQKATLKLLGEFCEFCRENELPFWLAQGSLLGAVRHGGFIPWDDDLDVGMVRSDLERAVEAVEGDGRYRITQVFDCCVKCRQVRFRYADEAIPVFLDIFIFDPVSAADAETLAKREAARERLVEQLAGNEGLGFWNEEDQFVEVDAPEAAPIANTFDFIRNSLIADGTYAESLEDADGVIWAIENVDSGIPNHGWYLIPKEVLLPFGTVEFEGLEVSAPADPETFLESYFGDIYSFPKEFGTYYNHMAGESQSEAEQRRVLLELLDGEE